MTRPRALHLSFIIELANLLLDRGEMLSARRLEDHDRIVLAANLEWPTQITGTEFFRLIRTMPKGKIHGFLSN